MAKAKRIVLSRSCLYNMIGSVIECWPLEPTGLVSGIRRGNKHILTNSYPIQTANREVTEVNYGDEAAIQRLIKFYGALRSTDEIESTHLGGFHGHKVRKDHSPEKKKVLNSLGGPDLHFIKQWMPRHGLDYWIEVLIKTKASRYTTVEERGVTLTPYERKLGVLVRDTAKHGYNMVISAFLIDRDLKVSELEITREKRRPKRK